MDKTIEPLNIVSSDHSSLVASDPKDKDTSLEKSQAFSLLSASRKKILKKKVGVVSNESTQLKKTLSKKNKEIADLKRSMQSLSHVINDVPSDDYFSSPVGIKLIDVIKENRYLKVQLEQSKVQTNKKECIVESLNKELRKFRRKKNINNEFLADESDDLEELQHDFRLIEEKVHILSQKNAELQSLVAMAEKLLQQEIGKEFSLTEGNIHLGLSNWRGRAQQLAYFQNREKYLLEEVNAYKTRISELTKLLSRTRKAGGGYASSEVSAFSNLDKVSCQVLNNIEIEDDSSIGTMLASESDDPLPNLGKANMELRLEHLKAKLFAANIKNKTSAHTIEELKAKLSKTQKSLNTFKEESTNLKQSLEDHTKKHQEELEALRKDLEKVTFERDNAFGEIDELSERIEKFEQQLQKNEEDLKNLSKLTEKRSEGKQSVQCELRRDDVLNVINNLETQVAELMTQNDSLKKELSLADCSLEEKEQEIKKLHQQMIDFKRGAFSQQRESNEDDSLGMPKITRLGNRKEVRLSLPKNSSKLTSCAVSETENTDPLKC